MRRAARFSASLSTLVAQRRWQPSTDKETAAASAGEAKAADTPAKTTAPPPPPPPPAADAAAAKSNAQEDYHFPTNEVLDAVKKRDFNAVQTHASKLVQSQWKEAYNVPAACIVIFVVMWYWIAWSRRSIRRKCEAMTASTKQQTEEMVDIVRGMTEKWKTDMAKANQQMQGIIDKNSELTRDIDRLTTALRSCSIRPTPASAATVTPTVSTVRRTPPVAAATEGTPAEVAAAATEAAETALSDKAAPSE